MDEEMEEEEDNPFDISTNPISNAHVVRELARYRNDARHLYMHYEGSIYWNALPFDIPPCMWYDYYSMLERYTNLFLHGNMYVHRRVAVPCEVTSKMRDAVY